MGLKGRATDQCAIDIGLTHQLTCVGWLDAAAVLNANMPGRGFVIELGQQPADERMDFLRLHRGGGLAGTNRPDGFVCNNGFDHLLFAQSLRAAAYLGLQNFVRLDRFTFRECFADAEDAPELQNYRWL